MAYNRLQKLRDNIEAIRTAFRLNAERRPADDAEWDTLSRYAGFGGLKCILLPADELADAARWTKSDREYWFNRVITLGSIQRLQYNIGRSGKK